VEMIVFYRRRRGGQHAEDSASALPVDLLKLHINSGLKSLRSTLPLTSSIFGGKQLWLRLGKQLKNESRWL